MNRFVQHVPNYVGHLSPISFEFSSTDELLAHPHVQSWLGAGYIPFIADKILMIESSDHLFLYVLGYIDNPSEVDLPRWTSSSSIYLYL